MSTNERPEASTEHNVFVTCHPRTANGVADDLENELRLQGVQARVLLYGITSKDAQGFVILACQQAIPARFERWLRGEREILDYVIYSVPLPNEQREINDR